MRKQSTSVSESDVVERVIGSETSPTSLSSRELSDASESPFLLTEVALTSRYGRKREVIPDDYVKWQNIIILARGG